MSCTFAAGNDPIIWTYVPMIVQLLEDIKSLVKKAMQARKEGSQFPFVIYDKELGKIVGSTRFLNISKENWNLEIGSTWLSSTVWRTRINTECKYLLLKVLGQFAFALKQIDTTLDRKRQLNGSEQ